MQVADASEELPTLAQAQGLAHELLADQGTRLPHVLTAGRIAARVADQLGGTGLLAPAEAHLLVVAATVHDIGYAPRVAKTGFHPYDGAVHLRASGWPAQLCRLVANHSCARVTAPQSLTEKVQAEFPEETGLLPDALAYSDMHSSPVGQVIPAEVRLADIAVRHADPREDLRAVQLRLALTRVGDALLTGQDGQWPSGATTGPRTVRRSMDPGLRVC